MDRPAVGTGSVVTQNVMQSLGQFRWLRFGSCVIVVSACAERSPTAPTMEAGGQPQVINTFVQDAYVERVTPQRLERQLVVGPERRGKGERRYDVENFLGRPGGKPLSGKGRRWNLEQKRKYCERLPREHEKFAACQTWLRDSSSGEQTRRKARVRQKRQYCVSLAPTDKGYQRCKSWLNSSSMREKRTRK